MSKATLQRSRTRDLVPEHLMPYLARSRVPVTNWHGFEPQAMQQGGANAKVVRAGVKVRKRERIRIGGKSTTARALSPSCNRRAAAA